MDKSNPVLFFSACIWPYIKLFEGSVVNWGYCTYNGRQFMIEVGARIGNILDELDKDPAIRDRTKVHMKVVKAALGELTTWSTTRSRQTPSVSAMLFGKFNLAYSKLIELANDDGVHASLQMVALSGAMLNV